MSEGFAIDSTILRGVVGSTAHGLAIEGQDDRDEMGICVEPPEYVMGLRVFEQYIQRDRPEGVRSQPGDLDLTIYSLRKWARLAAKGNPSVLTMLWLPEYTVITSLGEELVELRHEFVSQEAGKRFLGYLTSQKMKLTGERSKTVNRPDLVEKYGFDTKFAMHALRLGFEGIEYVTEGRLTLPIAEPNLSTLRSLRTGGISYADTLKLIENTEQRLREATEQCRAVADYRRINDFLCRAHQRHWYGEQP